MEKMTKSRYILSWVSNHSQKSCETKREEFSGYVILVCYKCNSEIIIDEA